MTSLGNIVFPKSAVGAGNDGFVTPDLVSFVTPDLVGFVMPDVIGHLLLPQGRDCRSGPAMTWSARPAMTVFVMPDVIGHLLLPQGRDCRSGPAMTRKFAGEPVFAVFTPYRILHFGQGHLTRSEPGVWPECLRKNWTKAEGEEKLSWSEIC